MNNREKFLSKNSLDGGFLQSQYWFNFQEKLGREVFWVKTENNQVLVLKNKLPFVGSYLYIPRGPILVDDEEENLKIVNEIKNKAKQEGAGWVRFELQKKDDQKFIQGRLIKSKKNHQPAETLILDLNQSLEDILVQMKQKTRYNIKLSQKKGVKIQISKNKEDIDIFWDLVQETAERDGVTFHNKDYYKTMFATIPRDNLELLLAKDKNNRIIGAILVSYFGKVATYLHGASSNSNRKLMANYLLQWKAIERAKKKGMKKYDFFGIAVNENQEKWAGITRFKKGFVPKVEPTIFPGCWDLVLSPVKYIIYRVLQLLK